MEEVPLTGSCCGNMPNCGHTFGKTDDEYAEEIYKFLSGSYTDKGINAWWNRKRSALGGKTPKQAWNEGERKKIYDLAAWLVYGGAT